MKYVLVGIGIVAAALIGWWFVTSNTQAREAQAPAAVREEAQPTPQPTAQPGAGSSVTPVAGRQEAPKGITMAEVGAHNGEASCWTVVNGNVYDVTSFIDKHPGGRRNVLKLCGTDGTAEFTGQHGGQSQPESVLAGLEIGALTQ